MKMKMKTRYRSDTCNRNRPRSRHGHKYSKYKCLSVIIQFFGGGGSLWNNMTVAKSDMSQATLTDRNKKTNKAEYI